MIVKEFRELRRDRRTVGLLVAMPVLLLVVFGYAANFNVSSISTAALGPQAPQAAQLLSQAPSSPFTVIETDPAGDAATAQDLLQRNRVDVALVTGGGTPVAYVDGSSLFSAQSAVAVFNRFGDRVQVQILYNPQLKTSWVMVPAIIGLILTFIGTVVTSIGMVKEKQSGTIDQLAVMPLRPSSVTGVPGVVAADGRWGDAGPSDPRGRLHRRRSASGCVVSVLLEARGLSCRFGDFLAVDDVSFAVEPGEVVGLIGANGAGKTTTLRMLLGLQRPTAGAALLNGAAPDRSGRARLGYVPQGSGLYAELTVAENLAFSAGSYGVQPAVLPGALLEVRDRLVSTVPLGLRRHLAFLCAVQHRPAVLVLDEPTSGVDPLGRARLWDGIREQVQQGAGVLVTTHHMGEARQCDRLLLMAGGRIVGRGTEPDLVAGVRAVRVACEDWAAAFTTLTEAGLPVMLAGREVRVVDRSVAAVAAALDAGGVTAHVEQTRATLEERMTVTSAG